MIVKEYLKQKIKNFDDKLDKSILESIARIERNLCELKKLIKE